jgi:large subunit ribosomal protein L32
MAVPKRRQSKSRRDKRRTHYKAEMPSWTTCPNCNEPARPHHVCEKCGYYKNRKVLEVSE